MAAIRLRKRIRNGQLIIDLPDSFAGQEVEVLVSPIDRKVGENRSALRELLLRGPCITKEEIEAVRNVRNRFDRWKVRQFS